MLSFKTKHLMLVSGLAAVLIFLLLSSPNLLAQSVLKLSYQANAGTTLKYASTRQDTRISEREGETSEFTTHRTYVFQLVAEKTDSLLNFILTVDSLSVLSEGGRGRGPQPFDPTIFSGKRFKLKITPQGETREFTAIDSIPMPASPDRRGDRPFRGPFGNPLNQLRINFFQLPNKAIKVGDSWTEPYKETDASRAGGFFGRFAPDQKVEGTTKYTVLGEEKKQGLTCLHIKIESTYSRSYEGERQGNTISSESEGEIHSDVWFATKEGLLVEYTQNDFNEGTTAFSGRTMPNSNESKFTLKLLEWKPKK